MKSNHFSPGQTVVSRTNTQGLVEGIKYTVSNIRFIPLPCGPVVLHEIFPVTGGQKFIVLNAHVHLHAEHNLLMAA